VAEGPAREYAAPTGVTDPDFDRGSNPEVETDSESRIRVIRSSGLMRGEVAARN
jgi:hypothetical protein